MGLEYMGDEIHMGLEYTGAEIHMGLEYTVGWNTQGLEYNIIIDENLLIIVLYFQHNMPPTLASFKYNDLLCETITHSP